MEVEFLLSDPQDKLIESFVTNDEKNSTKASSALNTLLVKISKKETTLLSIIKDLHPLLTSTNQIHRSRSLLLLFNVLDRCQDLAMSSQEFVSLYEFFISKMTDIAATSEALKCIYNLLVRNSSSHKKIFDDDKKLFDDFIGVLESKSFHTPAYAQEVRLNVYLILKHFTQNCEKFCTDLDDKFLRIILDNVEEEQDPRNLMISFKLIFFLLDRLPEKTVSLFKRDIFEILSMYYPITFKPPENDVFKITPDDLEGELNMCLCHSHLLDQTVEMVFDKVSASQDSAKIACLNTLELLVQKHFNRGFMGKYAGGIWDKVKPTYYHSNSAEVEDRCLKFLEKFLKQPLTLNFEKGMNSGILEDITTKIINTSLADIQKGTTTQNANKAIKLLVLLSSVTEDLSVIILNKFAHVFTDKYEIQNTPESQAWLEYFFRLYDSWDKHFRNKADPNGNLFGVKLDVFKVAYLRLRDIINSSLSSESARIIALKIYAQATNMLYRTVGYHEGYADICKLMEATTQTLLMKECVADALVIGSQNHQIVEVDESITRVIEIFEQVYCNNKIAEEGTLENYFAHNTRTMFYVLKTFSTVPTSGKQVLNLLLKFLVGQLQNLTIGFDNLLIAIKTLNQVVTNVKDQIKNKITPEELETISSQIFDLLVANNSLEVGLLNLKQADKLKYLSLKNDFKNILAQFSGSTQFIKKSFAYFIDALNKELYANGSQLKVLGWALETIKELPYQTEGKEAFKVFASSLETKNLQGVSKEAVLTLGRILRSFSNKTKDNDVLIKLLGYLGKVYKESGDSNKLTLYCYAIKGLIAKGDRTGFQCMLQFLNTALPYISEGKDIQTFTVCYRVLIKDIKKNFAEYNISTTSKQRLFSMIFPYSYTLYQKGRDENNAGVKEFFTAVIMYLITQISFKILKSNFQQILPIILENIAKLNEQHFDNLEYSIDFIAKVLEEREEISERVEELASNLLVILRLFREKEREIPDDFYVRNVVNIIKSLIKIARFPLTNIKTLREQVLAALEPEKANRKRAVRKMVVGCINEWHTL